MIRIQFKNQLNLELQIATTVSSNLCFCLISKKKNSWITSSARLGSEGQLSEFIEGLGPGQLVGRQVLASPALGEIQLSLCDRRGHLEVEVIRARGLQCKPGSKVLPGNQNCNLVWKIILWLWLLISLD